MNLFQFPSNGKAYPKLFIGTEPIAAGKAFQFPSNGKAYPKKGRGRTAATAVKVSIPFKRESVSKVRFPRPL